MTGRTSRRATLLALPMLALGACGGLEDEPDTGSGTAPGIVSGGGPLIPDPISSAPAASGPPASMTAPAPDVTGFESARTDCARSLPCALRSLDGAFEILLTRAGGEPADGGGAIVVDFSIEALSRDLELGVDTASSVAAGRATAAASSARFGDGSADAPAGGDTGPTIARHDLRPGTTTTGRLRFTGIGGGVAPALDRVELVVHEAGAALRMAFAGVPLGPAVSGPVDCALALPCEAISPDGALTLRVDAVGLERWHNYTRTIVDWSVAGPRAAELELTDAAGATTDAGHVMEYYGIEFGGTTSRGEGALGDALSAGGTVAGRTVFRRSPPEGTRALAALELTVGERRTPAVPGWRALFERLPVAR